MNKQKQDLSFLQALSAASSAGINLLVSVVACLFLGHELDIWVGTLPLFTILGGFVGGFIGLYAVYKQMVRDNDGTKK